MVMDNLRQMPIIDWEEGIRLAGHKKELARDILNMLSHELSDSIGLMHQLHEDKKYQELTKTVHKLHGAVCYTGTPRLKTILSTLETSLKSNIMDNSTSLLNLLDTEVRYLLEHIASHNQQLNHS